MFPYFSTNSSLSNGQEVGLWGEGMEKIEIESKKKTT
jgi:hypothetical protein